MLTVKRNQQWKLYWGSAPLPAGAEAIGTVARDTGETGALIRLASGTFVQGNAGALRALNDREVQKAIVTPSVRVPGAQ